MVFTEFSYALFLIISVFSFLVLAKKYRLIPLIVISILFYWYFAGDFVFVLIAETLIFYFVLRHIKRNSIFLVVMTSVVGILVYFKYSLLIANMLDSFLPIRLTPLLPEQVVAPLAISFFTFEFVHYLIDTKNGKIKEHSFIKYLAFIFFFPTMFAGPIKRYEPFEAQLDTAKVTSNNLRVGLFRILIGFFKKVVIADTLSEWVTVLNTQQAAGAVSPYILWLAVFAYAIKIYMDFSGYSDIAIGSARLFGIKVPENFNMPYLKGNISLFWKNWHMSLTSWIWDYIYLPLSASLRNILRNPKPLSIVTIVAVSSFVTMLIVGLWHGAAWHFVAWGAYHGILLVGYTYYVKYLKPHLAKHSWYHTTPIKWAFVGITFFFVLLSWPFFVTDIETAFFILQRMFFL